MKHPEAKLVITPEPVAVIHYLSMDRVAEDEISFPKATQVYQKSRQQATGSLWHIPDFSRSRKPKYRIS